MKKILKLLSSLTISISITPTTLTLSKITTQSKNFINATPKFIKLSYEEFSYIRLSDTTAILLTQTENNAYLFDSTKINEPSKGITALNKKGFFYRFSDTTGIFQEYGNPQACYFFDSTKINEPSKGFINLNITDASIHRLSETMAIFNKYDGTNLNAYLFDSTKINEPSKGLTSLNKKRLFSFYRLSDTTGIIIENNQQIYFFDSTKINEPSKGFIKFEKKFAQFIRLSDTTAIFSDFYNILEAYFFDSTKINEPSKGLTRLNKKLNNFYPLSDTTGIFEELINNNAYLFDSTKINEPSKGLTRLNKKGFCFYRLSDTIGLFKEWGTFNIYLFDSMNSNEFIPLNKKLILFYRLNDTLAIFREPNTDRNANNAYLFDSTKINEPSKGITALNKINITTEVLSNTTALFKDERNTTYYFEYN